MSIQLLRVAPTLLALNLHSFPAQKAGGWSKVGFEGTLEDDIPWPGPELELVAGVGVFR